jgi:predicted ATPase
LNRKKIVITGGPGTGKTSIINELKNQNYYCFEEIIRSLTLEAKKEKEDATPSSNPIAFVSDPLDFNTRLLNGRLNQFEQAAIIEKPLIFFDRGIPDVLAYMSFFNQSYSEDFLNVCLNHKYNHVFLLPPWESIYEVDNERFESFEEAVRIHDFLEAVYIKLGYHITEVPYGSIQERTHFIINSL